MATVLLLPSMEVQQVQLALLLEDTSSSKSLEEPTSNSWMIPLSPSSATKQPQKKNNGSKRIFLLEESSAKDPCSSEQEEKRKLAEPLDMDERLVSLQIANPWLLLGDAKQVDKCLSSSPTSISTSLNEDEEEQCCNVGIDNVNHATTNATSSMDPSSSTLSSLWGIQTTTSPTVTDVDNKNWMVNLAARRNNDKATTLSSTDNDGLATEKQPRMMLLNSETKNDSVTYNKTTFDLDRLETHFLNATTPTIVDNNVDETQHDNNGESNAPEDSDISASFLSTDPIQSSLVTLMRTTTITSDTTTNAEWIVSLPSKRSSSSRNRRSISTTTFASDAFSVLHQPSENSNDTSLFTNDRLEVALKILLKAPKEEEPSAVETTSTSIQEEEPSESVTVESSVAPTEDNTGDDTTAAEKDEEENKTEATEVTDATREEEEESSTTAETMMDVELSSPSSRNVENHEQATEKLSELLASKQPAQDSSDPAENKENENATAKKGMSHQPESGSGATVPTTTTATATEYHVGSASASVIRQRTNAKVTLQPNKYDSYEQEADALMKREEERRKASRMQEDATSSTYFQNAMLSVVALTAESLVGCCLSKKLDDADQDEETIYDDDDDKDHVKAE